ncbi:hypothetical protein TSOC_006655 [Tetrabaena socialis]|uniref:Uncharacterized protein n=1 Tax=Tetrabaena socialis TaxID=47790 RepID=A0A2J8A332_9CHLO|nr:hypothetical protein TSOC_006655 [Tetrabaena socialis]|eukprot:PNH06924.1 hypothetical protein TSOC_006655 [Tetrabaena socialis]
MAGPGLAQALSGTRDLISILGLIPIRPAVALRAMTTHSSPVVTVEVVALAAALLSWAFYLLTKNCSHVDRLWSLLPPVYVAIFARRDLEAVARQVVLLGHGGKGGGEGPWVMPSLAALSRVVADSGADPRLLLAAALSLAWGVRLTYNFWRKGGYRPSYEDYRWLEVRKTMPPWAFELFSLFFIAAAQHLLCLLITVPAFVASVAGRRPLGVADWAAALVFLLLLVGEAAADQQQWAFQQRKKELLAKRVPLRGDLRRGFRTTGLFRFSRHPSFFGEYGMWWAFYFLCAALPSGCGLGWAAAGAVGLTLLFHGGSLWITERISRARYPAYAAYQRTTSAIIPWLPGPALPEDRD